MRIGCALGIVYRQVFEVPLILPFEPSMHTSSLRSNVISSMKIHSLLEQGLRDFLFQQLGMLVSIVKQHIRPYLPQVCPCLIWHNLRQLNISISDSKQQVDDFVGE